jgi:hypothetical protein
MRHCVAIHSPDGTRWPLRHVVLTVEGLFFSQQNNPKFLGPFLECGSRPACGIKERNAKGHSPLEPKRGEETRAPILCSRLHILILQNPLFSTSITGYTLIWYLVFGILFLIILHARSLTRSCTSDFFPLLEIVNCAAKDQAAQSPSRKVEEQKLQVTFLYCRNSLKQCAASSKTTHQIVPKKKLLNHPNPLFKTHFTFPAGGRRCGSPMSDRKSDD